MSEFTILRAAINAGHPWIAAAILLMLAIIFVGMAALVLGVALGEPEPGTAPVRESPWLGGGPPGGGAAGPGQGEGVPPPGRGVVRRSPPSPPWYPPRAARA